MKYIHIVQERVIVAGRRGEWSQRFFATEEKAYQFWLDRVLINVQLAGNVADQIESLGEKYERLAIIPNKQVGGSVEVMVMNKVIE